MLNPITKYLFPILICFLLTSCTLVDIVIDVQTPSAIDDPNASSPPTSTPEVFASCIYNWARQPLPTLSEKWSTALIDSGLPVANAYAEAYGENCIDSQNGEIRQFLTLESDFYVILEVPELDNKEQFGQLVAEVFVVLDSIPEDEIPGPQTGYLGITFTHAEEELHGWFLISEVQEALSRGLKGAALWNTLATR